MSEKRHKPRNPLRRGRGRPHQPVTGGARAAPDSRPELPGGLEGPDATLAPVLAYLDRMLLENTRLNLTAIRDRDAALILHVADSLEVRRVVATEPRVIVDLGSGNGFPGVAAACLWPAARTILVERTGKKAAAIRRCLDDVGLGRVEVLAIDAAQLPALHPELRQRASLVLVRALGTLQHGIDLAAPLLAPAGSTLVQWKAAAVAAEERDAAQRSAKRLRLQARDDHVYVLAGDDDARTRRLVCHVRP